MEQKSEGEAVHEHAIAHTSDQKDKEESRLETLEKEEEFAVNAMTWAILRKWEYELNDYVLYSTRTSTAHVRVH